MFRNTDGGTTWSTLNADLSRPGVIALAVDPVTPRQLYADTAGDGVFDLMMVSLWKIIPQPFRHRLRSQARLGHAFLTPWNDHPIDSCETPLNRPAG